MQQASLGVHKVSEVPGRSAHAALRCSCIVLSLSARYSCHPPVWRQSDLEHTFDPITFAQPQQVVFLLLPFCCTQRNLVYTH